MNLNGIPDLAMCMVCSRPMQGRTHLFIDKETAAVHLTTNCLVALASLITANNVWSMSHMHPTEKESSGVIIMPVFAIMEVDGSVLLVSRRAHCS